MVELIKDAALEDVKKSASDKKEVKTYKPFKKITDEVKDELPDLDKAYQSSWKPLKWEKWENGREKAWWYEKDAKNVYTEYGSVVEWADPKTFQVLGDNYWKDAKNIYWIGKKIEWADPKTFQVLGDNFSKDVKNVWYNLYGKIEWADPKTFKILGYNNKYNNKIGPIYSQDAKNIYEDTKKINIKSLPDRVIPQR